MTLIRLVLVAALALVSWRAVPARAEVGSYLLFDMADGTILSEYEPTALWYPASITKLMTAYVTFQAIEKGELKLTSPVKISPQANQQPPSRMGFPVGTVLTVETALRILMTKSANDIAFALAESVGGTLAGFVDRMNAAAADLGMTATMYDNPHGLPNEKQITTARDIAVLMMALTNDFPDRADFFSMTGVQLGARNIRNHNALLRQVEGADGMKTGFICASGFNVAATATRDGHRLGAVVLGGLTTVERNERAGELFEKGFVALADGGSVALDGFDKADGRLDLRPVGGTRLDLGTVQALANPVDATAADRRDDVCGARRPITRYSDGTVATVAAVEAQRAKVAAYRLKMAAQKQLKAELLAAPRPEPMSFEPAPPPERRLADAELVPAGWQPVELTLLPQLHPDRPHTAGAAASATAETNADDPAPQAADRAKLAPASFTTSAGPSGSAPQTLAPDGWTASPAFPIPNPLAVAELREAFPQPEPERPLTYLTTQPPAAPFPISLGGADAERPDPLSGAIVGGGPPPLPPARPALPANQDDTEPPSDVT
ncbi:hypothetical protein DLJ53_04995 [Acuticoccus sediminis]|uniref:Peptidase S11 D-alanyl-D-alanine carboxypeptidase A N-terminal domain-containing protein n=1 Tax=Acuticoccus sediminis TaxID=2184697 RepID=A0A8B2P5H5_9HYPH|nr:D-alanyl-D-alanine carboxypeptidase family protein [Acuticoccus sediminis]RAI03829.1 hypothetical protein DLJ53_04995 [Acuticoccus sediminis]